MRVVQASGGDERQPHSFDTCDVVVAWTILDDFVVQVPQNTSQISNIVVHDVVVFIILGTEDVKLRAVSTGELRLFLSAEAVHGEGSHLVGATATADRFQ